MSEEKQVFLCEEPKHKCAEGLEVLKLPPHLTMVAAERMTDHSRGDLLVYRSCSPCRECDRPAILQFFGEGYDDALNETYFPDSEWYLCNEHLSEYMSRLIKAMSEDSQRPIVGTSGGAKA